MEREEPTTAAAPPAELSGDEAALVQAERQRAVRLLLSHPLVTDRGPDPEAFSLLRRHGGFLRTWFAGQLGYRLVIEPDFARLVKRPAPEALPRPARTRSQEPFDGRRYSLACLALAALERMESQTVLSELASEVALLTASEEGIAPLDLTRFGERAALADAVRLLVDLGVLERADGDEAAFVAQQGDVLYDIAARRLTQLIAAPVPPSLAAAPEELYAEPYPETEEGANLRRRHRLLRRLLEEPVLYLETLDPEERAYLTSQRHFLVNLAKAATGLPVEVRREGLCLIDDGADMTDLPFPAVGTLSHAALLLAEFLSKKGPGPLAEGTGEHAPGPLLWREVEAEAARLVAEYGQLWRKEFRESASGPSELARLALGLLAAMGLARVDEAGVTPLPAIARFKAAPLPARPEAGDA